MIHSICDFCGKDTDRVASLITITPFQNFARYHTDNRVFGTEGPSRSFVICPSCSKKHDLPNPFHAYKEITSQKANYMLCLDNYDDKKDRFSTKSNTNNPEP